MAAGGSQYHGTTTNEVLSAITVPGWPGFMRRTAVSFTSLRIPRISFPESCADPFRPRRSTRRRASSQLLSEGQKSTDRIGSAKFDIGHVVSTGSGGVAGWESSADSGVAPLARRSSRYDEADSSIGDAFDVDYVAHEMAISSAVIHYNGTYAPPTRQQLWPVAVLFRLMPASAAVTTQANSDPSRQPVSTR